MTWAMWMLLLNVGATWFMVGLIWFVQVVHYPLFAGVGAEGFGDYSARHQRGTTWVVGGPMAVEGVTAMWLLWDRPVGMAMWAAVVGMGLLLVVWGSTAMMQVPCHQRLERGFDAAVHRRLVVTNWVRTAAWTARGLVLAAVVIEIISAGGGG
jgi:hypothetical protein